MEQNTDYETQEENGIETSVLDHKMHTSTEKRSEIVAIKPTAKDTKLNLK
jgi:hypothetical protein